MTTLATDQAAQFDVTDSQPFQRIIVAISYPNIGKYEIAYDGTAFVSGYDGTSTVTPITDGFRFVVLRDSNWPDTVVAIHVFAFDVDGFETDQTLTWDAVATPESAGGHLLSATPFSSTEIDLVFSLDVSADPESTRAANYQMRGTGTGDLTVVSVVSLGGTTVRVTTSEMVNNGDYLAVAGNITGVGSGPSFNQASFAGLGVGPGVVLVSPTSGATGVKRDHNVIVEVTDTGSGVDLSSIVAIIAGGTAVTGGTIQPGFDGPAASIIAVANGYRITMDPTTDFTFGEVVDITVTANDNVGNPSGGFILI